MKAKCTLLPTDEGIPLVLRVTDTVANWKETIEYCGNVRTNIEIDDDMETRHYAVWNDAKTNTIGFSRPAADNEDDIPRAKSISKYDVDENGPFELPDQQRPDTCASEYEKAADEYGCISDSITPS